MHIPMHYIRIYNMCFVAPTCFNITYCDGESFGNNSISFDQCCFEFLGVSFASPEQCMLCSKSGM